MILINSLFEFRRVTLLCLVSGVLILNGCESSKHPAVGTSESIAQEKEVERLDQCQKDLDALKSINIEHYKLYQQKFNRLMSGAAQYAGLRTHVNTEIQETVDALYRYKANFLCADIGQATLASLVESGEELK